MHGVEHVFGFHVAYGEVFGILGELFVEALLDQLRTQLKSLRWIHARTEFAWRLFLRRRRKTRRSGRSARQQVTL